jgi:hypothetical protein
MSTEFPDSVLDVDWVCWIDLPKLLDGLAQEQIQSNAVQQHHWLELAGLAGLIVPIARAWLAQIPLCYESALCILLYAKALTSLARKTRSLLVMVAEATCECIYQVLKNEISRDQSERDGVVELQIRSRWTIEKCRSARNLAQSSIGIEVLPGRPDTVDLSMVQGKQRIIQ